jgi:hypothetical protein
MRVNGHGYSKMIKIWIYIEIRFDADLVSAMLYYISDRVEPISFCLPERIKIALTLRIRQQY